LNELANSIKQHGIIQPLVVRKLGAKYEIIAGERRYRASQIAGLSNVPAIVKELSDDKSAELAVVENLQRQDLSPIEEAQSYQKLLDNDNIEVNTQGELANKLGVSQSAVANKLRLLGLCESVQEALLQNRISERHARSLLMLTEEEEQEKMLHKILEKKLTVRQTDEEIKELLGKKQIEPLAQGEKPVDVEQVTDIDEIQDLKPIEDKVKEIESLDLEENDSSKDSPKLDLTSLLQVDENMKNVYEEPEEKPKKKKEEKKEKQLETNIEKEESEANEKEKLLESAEESKKLNFNTQINPFQETEVLSFDDDENKQDSNTQILSEKIECGDDELKPLQHDLASVINESRNLVKKIENAGFVVNTEEFDFEEMYQIIIKIDKD